MYALAASIGWLITTCLLLWVMERRDRRSQEERTTERKAHRDEVAQAARALLEQAQHHSSAITAMAESHRQEIAALNQARCEEVANLCQRIQAPEQAAMTHAAANALPDPVPLDIEDDAELIANREAMLRQFGVLPEYEIAEAE